MNGYYPKTLSSIGLENPSTRIGGFRYRSYDSSFTMGIGDYYRNGFVVYYSSDSKKWMIDG